MNTQDASIFRIMARRMGTALTAAQIGALKRPPLKGRACKEIQDRLSVLESINNVARKGPGWQITAAGLQNLDNHEWYIKQRHSSSKPGGPRPDSRPGDDRDGGA